jgi:hypothetical protein
MILRPSLTAILQFRSRLAAGLRCEPYPSVDRELGSDRPNVLRPAAASLRSACLCSMAFALAVCRSACRRRLSRQSSQDFGAGTDRLSGNWHKAGPAGWAAGPVVGGMRPRTADRPTWPALLVVTRSGSQTIRLVLICLLCLRPVCSGYDLLRSSRPRRHLD